MLHYLEFDLEFTKRYVNLGSPKNYTRYNLDTNFTLHIRLPIDIIELKKEKILLILIY